MEKNILYLIYPKKEIFVELIELEKNTPYLTVKCKVPKTSNYVKNPVEYVTAENFVRILSQSCYLMADKLISEKLLPKEILIKSEEFRKAATNYQLYYRNIAMTFHKLVKKGDEFFMTLFLKRLDEIKRVDDFLLFSFQNKRTVISGEMSFVYKR